MKTIKYFGIFIILFSAVFAFNDKISAQSNSEILIVADQKVSCRGIVAMDCLQVKRLNEEKFRIFYQNIERFDFIPGYFYVLEVFKSETSRPLADASRYQYRLKKIMAQVKLRENSSDSGELNFFGTEWKLTHIAGIAVNSQKAFIRFDESKNSVGGNGGCNVFGGSIEKNGNNLTVSKVFSTKMFCESSQQIENKFLRSLDRVMKYRIENSKLYLMANDKVLLEFAVKK